MVWGLQPTAGVYGAGQGLIVAQFGAGTDDPDEVMQVVDRALHDFVERGADPSRPPTHFVRRATHLAELFAPATPETEEIRDGIVWAVGPQGLWPILRDRAQTERLLGAFRRASSAGQWLIVDDQWAAEDAFESELRALGIEMLQAAPGQPFLAEVRRPDERRLCGFVARPPVPSSRGGARPLARAPLLRRLLLNAVMHGDTSAVYDELLARTAGLAFFVGPDRGAQTMQWPGEPSPLLPVYADLESLYRTARELGRSPQSFAVGSLRAPELFAWASQNRFGLALGVFPDEGAVRYLRVDSATIGKLTRR
jgi:hypothetical protein